MPQRAVLGTLGIAFVLAAFAAQPASAAEPCVTALNPPGYGYRYTCKSTSTHTIEHAAPGHLFADFYRTRITARRDGEAEIYDVTIDSLSPPASDSKVQEAFAEAGRFVTEPTQYSFGSFRSGWTPDPPMLLWSSRAFVEAEPSAGKTLESRTDRRLSYSSTSSPRTFCVGYLGDVPEPVDLPQAPCAPGLTAVTLRPLDTSPATELHDALDDTNVHVQTDRYPELLITGNRTTSRYEVVARKSYCTSLYGSFGFPGGWHLYCASRSHHSSAQPAAAIFSGAAFTTRITGQRGGEDPLYDVTIASTVEPLTDDVVREALREALSAVRAAVGPGGFVNGPTTVFSSAQQVAGVSLPGGAIVRDIVTSPSPPRSTPFCVGDFGDLPEAPLTAVFPPCAPGLETASIAEADFASIVTHRHSRHDVYETLVVTGTLTTTHFAFVGERESPEPVTSVPVVVRPRPH